MFAQLAYNIFKCVGIKFLANSKFPRNTVLLNSATVANVGQSQQVGLVSENRGGRKILGKENYVHPACQRKTC